MGGCGLGVACGHIKAFGLFPFPHQRKICTEGLQGRHALSMLGRTLVCITYIHVHSWYNIHVALEADHFGSIR